ncbi:hypothetical protein IC575_014218 [Cucumis melo]
MHTFALSFISIPHLFCVRLGEGRGSATGKDLISSVLLSCKSAHIAAAKTAKDAGAVLSYDPNLRLPLWPSADSAIEGILSIWDTADIIKISEEEISFLTRGEDPFDDAVVLKLLL